MNTVITMLEVIDAMLLICKCLKIQSAVIRIITSMLLFSAVAFTGVVLGFSMIK